jgi:hypothetical protein
MIKVALDPSVLAVPAAPTEPDDYAACIQAYLDLSNLSGIQILWSGGAPEALALSDCYPHFSAVSKFIPRHSATLINSQTLTTMIERLVRRLQCLETAVDISDVVWDDAQVSGLTLDPAEPLDSVLLKSCIVVGFVISRFAETVDTIQISSSRATPGTLTAVADTITVEMSDRSLITQQVLNQAIAILPACGGLLPAIDPVTLALKGFVESALILAVINRTIEDRAIKQITEVPKLYLLNREFAESALRNAANNRARMDSILRAAANAVLGLDMPRAHPLRTGPGGNDRQITRGAERAWRREVTDEYRLHYWLGGSIPELGCITVHNDFHIPG